MDKLQGVPVIGEKGNNREAVNAILNALKPTIDGFLLAVEEVQGRLGIIEELINGVLVDILAKRIEDKLNLGTGKKEEKK